MGERIYIGMSVCVGERIGIGIFLPWVGRLATEGLIVDTGAKTEGRHLRLHGPTLKHALHHLR